MLSLRSGAIPIFRRVIEPVKGMLCVDKVTHIGAFFWDYFELIHCCKTVEDVSIVSRFSVFALPLGGVGGFVRNISVIFTICFYIPSDNYNVFLYIWNCVVVSFGSPSPPLCIFPLCGFTPSPHVIFPH